MADPKYGVAYSFPISLVDTANRPDFKLSPTIEVGDFKIIKDTGPLTNLATTPIVTPAGSANVLVSLSALEMTASTVSVFGIDQAGNEWDDILIGISPNVITQEDLLNFTSSQTSICNLALSHIGVAKEIADLGAEKSQEAAACRRYFETARDNALRDYPWPFATGYATLALVATDPTTEWKYSYRYPTDCLFIRRVLSGIRNDNPQSRVPYTIVRDDTGLLIYTDMENAIIEYTVKEVDPTRYPSDFVMAFSLRLAAYIAPRLTGGDPFKLGDRALNLHAYEISKAKSAASNEQQDELVPESELIRGRE